MDVKVTANGTLKLIATNDFERYWNREFVKQRKVTLHEHSDQEYGFITFHKDISHKGKSKSTFKPKLKGNGKDPLGIDSPILNYEGTFLPDDPVEDEDELIGD